MEDYLMATRGVDRQGTRWMLEGEKVREMVRLILGLVLFVLLAGIWAYLWVSPSPVF
jgi:hypothetical protein